MKVGIDPISLLVLWWRFERGWIPVESYPTECPSTRGFRASRQYDYGADGNGAGETDERGRIAMSVGHIVDSMEEPYRTALYVIARNRSTGKAVWRSPRLPEDETKRMEICARAVDMFVEQV